MNRNQEINGGSAPFLMAALACLVCLPIMYITTRPLLWVLHGQGVEWLLLSLFTTVPLLVTFLILYYSPWHRSSPRARRIFSSIFSACLIFGVDLLFVVFTVIVGCLIVALSRTMGGN
jgi:hypothetical protein